MSAEEQDCQNLCLNVKNMSSISTTTKQVTISERPLIMPHDLDMPEEKVPLSVPATDSSWAAFRVFAAALLSEGLLFGICLSFGVFQDYYTNRTDLPSKDRSSWIGLLSAGIAYLGAPLVTYVCQTWALPRHYYIYVGWTLCLAGLLSSAFCKTITSLIITQGLLFGFGLLIVEMPTLMIINSWFVKRRGLAYGLLFGLTDLFGVVWGFLANSLLHHHGMRTTFLVFTVICFVVPAFGIYFLRERPLAVICEAVEMSTSVASLTSLSGEPEKSDFAPTARYYHHTTFYLLFASNLLQAFAFYLPFIYLPSYTTALGYSPNTGAVVLAIINIAQVFGEIGFGRFSDKARVPTLVFISAAVSSTSAFLIWSFASSLAYLIPFAILFGAFGSGFLALWPRMGTMFGEKDASMIYSTMSFGRGVAMIASGPISTALLVGSSNTRGSHLGSVMHMYGPVVMFVGGCMAGSALLGLIARLLPQKGSRTPPSEDTIPV